MSLRGMLRLAVEAGIGVLLFAMGLRFLGGEPVLPELAETMAMWRDLLSPTG